MRISDWSSDVCSSDLWRKGAPSIDFLAPDIYFPNFVEWTQAYAVLGAPWFIPEANQAGAAEAPANALYAIGALGAFGYSPFSIDDRAPGRSEEHTSELQSLMRISYAVFFLKKKKHTHHQ